MTIYFGTDHAGFELKENLVPYVRDELGYEVEDLGAHEYNEDDDYPDVIAPVATTVSADPENNRGIILGGSGQGEAIVANRFPRVRAVVFNGQYAPGDGRDIPHEIELSREHNNSNVLSLGARFLSVEEAREAVKQWLETPFSGDERHIRRLKKIEELTNHLYR
ncbi:MAG: RpiB/LacA/LacB family sugar-phosphate isomerase [Candidatus Paceibacterota bacterium]